MRLIFFECLALFLIWWGGLVLALGKRPGHRNVDSVERQRRADWVRNEFEQRPWLWLAFGLVAMIALADWFWEKWEQRLWRAAMLWTLAMVIVLVVVVELTMHFGWEMKPIKV